LWLSTDGGSNLKWFDLTNGTTGGSGTSVTEIEPIGDGWFRCSFSRAASSTTNANFIYASNSTITASFAGDDTSGLFIWGAQLETGSFASTYIPTTTTALTRNADVLTVTGASGVIGQESGWIYAEVDFRALGIVRRVIVLSADTTNLNSIELIYLSSNAIILRTRQNDVNVGEITSTPFTSGFYKIAYTYKENEFRLIVNGVVLSTITNGAVNFASTVERIAFSSAANNDNFFNDHIYRTAIGKTTLTEQQAIELTTI
jgi:hypothetical protein